MQEFADAAQESHAGKRQQAERAAKGGHSQDPLGELKGMAVSLRFNLRELSCALSGRNMTWEWHCNYTFPASFTFINFALINVRAVPVQDFKATVALQRKRRK